MSAKEVITIVIAGLISFVLAFCFAYFLSNTGNNNELKISTGTYTLNYGVYVGYEEEYDQDTKRTNKKEIKVELLKNKVKINGEDKNYKIKNDQIYVDNVPLYKVVGNNKFVLLAGAGVEFKYEK